MPRETTALRASHVGDVVDRVIRKLQEGVRANRSTEVAALAKLRRAVGKPIGSQADVLQYTLDRQLVFDDGSSQPSYAEKAAHTCITLYALHQQGKRDRMYVPGDKHGFGTAIRRLAHRDIDPANPVVRRFQTLGTASTFDELIHHARGLVQQLRGASIPVDYQRLACQLYDWQFPGGPERVRLVWGRGFYLPQTDEPLSTDEQTTDDPEEQ